MNVGIAAVLVLIFVVPAIVRLFCRYGVRAARIEPGAIRLTVTDAAFIVKDLRSRSVIEAAWSSICKVAVIRTARGPFRDDLYYHVVFVGGEVTLPSKSRNMAAFISRLTALPGFRPAAYATAMRSKTTDSFVVCLQPAPFRAGADFEAFDRIMACSGGQPPEGDDRLP